MNIAFVNATRKWGGVKTWMLDVGQALRDRGHEIFVFGRQDAFVRQARERTGHGEQVFFGPDLNPVSVGRFMHAFRQARVQAVFVNVEKDLATAGVAARLLGIPVIQRIGMPGDIPLRSKTRLLHRFISPFFFCPCQYIADGFGQSLPYVDPGRVKVMLTAKHLSTGPLQAHSPRQLVATQQLNPDKGHEVLLRALAGIQIPFVLHVAGTGSCETRLKALAADLGLQDRVVWHGFTTSVATVLRQSDMFLLASLAEGLPNTLLEAQAAGLLPIIRDVGGVREVMPPELDAWILPPEAGAEDFRAVIDRALSLSDAQLLHLRETSRAACYALKDMAGDLEAWLTNEVLGGA